MDFLLGRGHSIQLDAHVLDLLSLSVVDVGRSRDVLMTLFNFCLGRLILLGHVALSLLGLSKLNFDIAQRVLQFLVLNFAETEHLAVLDLCTFLSFNTEPSAHDTVLLEERSQC